jgi:hypothetical protein
VTDNLPGMTHPLRGLLVPGPRLGWRYQDPAAAMMAYGEAPPTPPVISTSPPVAPGSSQLVRRLLITGGLGLGFTGMLACCGFLAAGPSGAAEIGTQIKLTAVLLGLGTVGLIVVIVWRHQTRVSRAVDEAIRPQRQHQAALAMWQQRAEQHRAAEAARVAHLPVWQATGPQAGATRLDIVGGSQFGWRDLLTVAGAGYLATHGP